MDLPGSTPFQREVLSIRTSLKHWEHDFQKQHSRAPLKADVEVCPSIQQLYRQYSILKKEAASRSPLKQNKIDAQSPPRDRTFNDINLAAVQSERALLRFPQPASSDDSSGSYISSTPPRLLSNNQERNPFRMAHVNGIRRPLGPLSSNEVNKLPNHGPPSLTRTSKSKSIVQAESSPKVVPETPNRIPSPAAGLSSDGGQAHVDSQRKDPFLSCPLAVDGGGIIKLYRHGMHTDARPSSPSDRPVPAGHFSCTGPSSLTRRDRKSYSIFSPAKISSDIEGNAGHCAVTSPPPTGGCDKENRVTFEDGAKHNDFGLTQPAITEHAREAQAPTVSGVEVVDDHGRSSKVTPDDHRDPNANENGISGVGLHDASVTKGLRNRTVVSLKRKLREENLPITGKKSRSKAADKCLPHASSTDRDPEVIVTSEAPDLASRIPSKSSAGAGDRGAALKAVAKKVDLNKQPLGDSWSFPEILRKGTRGKKSGSSLPRKSQQQLSTRAGERDNFVRLNIRGKGGKGRKFVNGVRFKRPAAVGRGGFRGRKYRAKKATDANNEACVDECDQSYRDGECHSEKKANPSGEKESIWENDGYIPSLERLKGCKVNESNELTDKLKVVFGNAQKYPSDKNLAEVLLAVFGFNGFRTGQLEAIQRILLLQSTMLFLPTGGGKSLCYQLPACLLPGIILVISPLMALMEDQLRHLPPCLPGAIIHSGQTLQESSSTMARLSEGQVKVLFVSPERLFSESFLSTLSRLPKISLAVVDEAHCLSEWSHNFRPSYFRLGKVLQQMTVSCVLAMTATATKKAERSIIKSLFIPADGVVQASHCRPNLLLSVSREATRLKSLLSLLQRAPYLEAKSIIVYCSYQAETDRVSEYLQQNGIQAKSYHGKKNIQERNRVFALFCNNKLKVVVATVAFGMGLDKSDVRAIVHYNMPRSLEGYVQETGRAGRDGKPAYCHLFLDDGDYSKLRSLAYSDGVDTYSVNKFLSRVFESSLDSTNRGNLTSIIIEPVSKELDMKAEVMETVLSYLEVGEIQYVRVLSRLNATCTLSFYNTNPTSLAGRNALVNCILKRSKERQGRYVFDLTIVANQLRMSLSDVQFELRRLQIAGEVSFELSDPALWFTVMNIPEDICSLTSKITARLSEAEQCQVKKLDAMYLAASAAVHNLYEQGLQETDSFMPRQQASLQTNIKSYFEMEDDLTASKRVPTIIRSDSFFVCADIKVFLSSVRNPNMTGRAVARIFHGLWSPAFPLSEWSKNHFWGMHPNVDFEVIKQAAAAEILALRATNRHFFLL